jgi:hypothetical protein
MDTLSDEQIAPLRRKWLTFEKTTVQAESELKLTAEQMAWIAENPIISVHNETDWPLGLSQITWLTTRMVQYPG